MNKHYLQKASFLSLMLGGLFVHQEAQAQMAVAVVNCPASVCAGETTQVQILSTLQTQLTTLNQTEQRTNVYLTTGMGGQGGGMIALLGGINERLGMVTEYNDQAVENMDLANRGRIYDERLMDMQAERMPRPSNIRRACVQAGRAAGGAAGGRAAGRGTDQFEQELQERFNDTRTEFQARLDTVRNRNNLGVCSALDVSEQRPGCTTASAGDRPGADMRLDAIYTGGARNGDRTEREQAIARQYITNVGVRIPPQLSKETLQGGRNLPAMSYMMDLENFEARALAANGALARIAAHNVTPIEGQTEEEQAFLTIWRSSENRKVWEEVFGVGTFPRSPSQNDIVSLSVMRHFASTQNTSETGSLTAEEIQLRQYELAAANARVNLLILERMQDQTAILSALLSQSLSPMTDDELRSRAVSTSTGTTTAPASQ